MKPSPTPSLSHPKYWPSWILVLLLRLIVMLPMPSIIKFGKALGRLLYRVAKRRRHITETNIALCFPELSESDQEALVIEIFEENAAGMFEAVAGWLKPKLTPKLKIANPEVLDAARANGKGVLLLSAHYTHIDISGKLFGAVYPFNVLYRPQNNAVINHIMEQGRQDFLEAPAINQHDMRSMVRCLKAGQILWYPFDQDHGRKSSVFAPFFGIQAATLSIPSRLIKMSGCEALFCYHYRDTQGTYHIEFQSLNHFDGKDMVREATELNQHLAHNLRRLPSQYMWVHRRFKTRPDGENSVY